MARKLTIKQVRFVEFYNGNGYEAAKRAGYKGNYETLSVVASENLKKPYILEALGKREKKRNASGILSVTEIQEKWSKIIRGTNKDKEFDSKDIMKAMHDLTKSHGGFLDRIEADNKYHIKVEMGTITGKEHAE